ncbi:hypothetical protein [Streptomyces sp. NPDC051704]
MRNTPGPFTVLRLAGVGPELVISMTAEIHRRQPDGGWAHVMVHPFFG